MVDKMYKKMKLQSFASASVRPRRARDLKKKIGSNGRVAMDCPSNRLFWVIKLNISLEIYDFRPEYVIEKVRINCYKRLFDWNFQVDT